MMSIDAEGIATVMHKTEMRRFVAVMEFFYGFLFGVAFFGATFTFLVTPSFFIATLFAVCVFAFFIFLTAIVRYCIMRIKLSDEMLQVALRTQYLQEQLLQSAQQEVCVTDENKD